MVGELQSCRKVGRALQGFPTWHRFRGRYIKKQIGNAFAPSVVKILYDHLVAWLLQQDGFDPAVRRRLCTELPDDLPHDNDVVLDDDCEGDGDGAPRAGFRGADGPREPARQLGQAARDGTLGDWMDLDVVDELSDTATVREGQENADHDAMCIDTNVVDPPLDGCTGTEDNPYVLLDRENLADIGGYIAGIGAAGPGLGWSWCLWDLVLTGTVEGFLFSHN